MICPRCQGKGRVILTSNDKVRMEGVPIIVPCPDCNMSGFGRCCEGLSDAPEDLIKTAILADTTP